MADELGIPGGYVEASPLAWLNYVQNSGMDTADALAEVQRKQASGEKFYIQNRLNWGDALQGFNVKNFLASYYKNAKEAFSWEAAQGVVQLGKELAGAAVEERGPDGEVYRGLTPEEEKLVDKGENIIDGRQVMLANDNRRYIVDEVAYQRKYPALGAFERSIFQWLDTSPAGVENLQKYIANDPSTALSEASFLVFGAAGKGAKTLVGAARLAKYEKWARMNPKMAAALTVGRSVLKSAIDPGELIGIPIEIVGSRYQKPLSTKDMVSEMRRHGLLDPGNKEALTPSEAATLQANVRATLKEGGDTGPDVRTRLMDEGLTPEGRDRRLSEFDDQTQIIIDEEVARIQAERQSQRAELADDPALKPETVEAEVGRIQAERAAEQKNLDGPTLTVEKLNEFDAETQRLINEAQSTGTQNAEAARQRLEDFDAEGPTAEDQARQTMTDERAKARGEMETDLKAREVGEADIQGMEERADELNQAQTSMTIPQSAKTGSKIGQVIDVGFMKFNYISPTGKMIDGFYNGLHQYMRKHLGEGVDATSEKYGQVISDALLTGIDRFKTKHHNDMKALLSDGYYGESAPAGFANTEAAVDALIAQRRTLFAESTPDTKLLIRMKKDIDRWNEEGVTLGQIAESRTAWLREMRKPSPGDAATYSRDQVMAIQVLNGMTDDLYGNAAAIHPEKAAKLKELKAEYAAWIGVTQEQFFKDALGAARKGRYDTVVRALRKNSWLTDPEKLGGMRRALGESGWQDFQKYYAADFYQTVGNDKVGLSSEKMSKFLSENGDAMREVLGVEAVVRAARVRDILDQAKQLELSQWGSQTAWNIVALLQPNMANFGGDMLGTGATSYVMNYAAGFALTWGADKYRQLSSEFPILGLPGLAAVAEYIKAHKAPRVGAMTREEGGRQAPPPAPGLQGVDWQINLE